VNTKVTGTVFATLFLAFEGGSACLLGAVLARFFARHVSINSFTQTVLRSDSRDEINRWAPRWGARPTL
jgi:type VI secretion system protein ImpG